MVVKAGINGFGRIGRLCLRAAMKNPDVEIVAINGTSTPDILAHLFKYDTVHGTYQGEVSSTENTLIVDGHEIKCTMTRDPGEVNWKELGVDIVIEATGKFKDKESCLVHLTNGAKRVVITAPAKGEDATIVMGVNQEVFNPDTDVVISNASCTTNCLAPVTYVLQKEFGIKRGMMTTVHSYTSDQKILDNRHKDLRRARAGVENIVPTSTGAAKAIGVVQPELKGKLVGMAMRVPTPDVSLVDLVVELDKNTTVEEVNATLKKASETYMKGILGYTDEPLVSCDFKGDSRSSIVDGLSTMAVGDNMIKVISWYDNEWGYSCRVIDLVAMVGK